MKNTILTLVLFLLMISCRSFQKGETPFHPIVLKAKETSLYTSQVNWEEVNSTFIELTKDKQSVEEQKEGLQYLINSLGDKHASFRSAKDHSIIVYYTGKMNEKSNKDSNFTNTVINDVSAKFSYLLLKDGVGYLKIVGIGQGNVKEQAEYIRDGLRDLKGKGVDKWIVDLRYNGGGNIEPMLAGLAPLVGEGFIGGAINIRNEIREFKIENGQFYNWNRLVCEMDNTPKISSNEKVAVLLSRYTISSGEMTAVAFKGRDNTKFIGEETVGYTTGNGYDQVTDDLILLISQDVFIDRNKAKYDKKVGVDIYSEFRHNLTLENDNQIDQAVEWLNE